jgi:hypothetical protein
MEQYNLDLISLAEEKICYSSLFEHKSDEHKSDEHKSDEHKSDEHKSDEHKSDENDSEVKKELINIQLEELTDEKLTEEELLELESIKNLSQEEKLIRIRLMIKNELLNGKIENMRHFFKEVWQVIENKYESQMEKTISIGYMYKIIRYLIKNDKFAIVNDNLIIKQLKKDFFNINSCYSSNSDILTLFFKDVKSQLKNINKIELKNILLTITDKNNWNNDTDEFQLIFDILSNLDDYREFWIDFLIIDIHNEDLEKIREKKESTLPIDKATIGYREEVKYQSKEQYLRNSNSQPVFTTKRIIKTLIVPFVFVGYIIVSITVMPFILTYETINKI